MLSSSAVISPSLIGLIFIGSSYVMPAARWMASAFSCSQYLSASSLISIASAAFQPPQLSAHAARHCRLKRRYRVRSILLVDVQCKPQIHSEILTSGFRVRRQCGTQQLIRPGWPRLLSGIWPLQHRQHLGIADAAPMAVAPADPDVALGQREDPAALIHGDRPPIVVLLALDK